MDGGARKGARGIGNTLGIPRASLTRPRRRLLQRIENFCPYHESFDRFVRKGQLASWTAALMGGPVVASLAGTRAYSGRWGFDPDDALYLMGPLAWLGWLAPILIGASIGATAMMIISAVRLARLRRGGRQGDLSFGG